MIGLRHEKYGAQYDKCPFTLATNLERTPYNSSNEQNWHKNPEIQLCTSGEGTVLLDGKKYNFTKGDICVVNSDVIHYTYTESYLEYTCLIISTDWCDMMNINYDALVFSPIVKSPVLQGLLNQLTDVYSTDSDNLRIARLNNLLLQIMIELVEHHVKTPSGSVIRSKNFDIVKSTVAFLRKNYNRKITLDEISTEVFFDKYALCKEFKKYTGQTIIESLNHYRILKAIDYIKEGRSVSETAFLCGFENLSFFAKTFKKYTGKTPSSYKRTNF